jgi:AraC family transcriptional regulator
LASTDTAPRRRASDRNATSDAHEGSIEVSYGAQRLRARWSEAAKLSGFSIDRRAISRPAADAGEVLVHLHGVMAPGGAKNRAVHFGPELLARIDRDDAFARECVARLFDADAAPGRISAPFADALLRTLALHVATRYAAHAADAGRNGERLAAVLVRHLRTFIDARLDRRLSRSDLARLAGYDARAFSIAFRNTFGMTPMQYVIERRLDRACVLIAGTARDLADIAISAGFSSQSHLTSTLKKRRGITPLRLRREAARVSASA